MSLYLTNVICTQKYLVGVEGDEKSKKGPWAIPMSFYKLLLYNLYCLRKKKKNKQQLV